MIIFICLEERGEARNNVFSRQRLYSCLALNIEQPAVSWLFVFYLPETSERTPSFYFENTPLELIQRPEMVVGKTFDVPRIVSSDSAIEIIMEK